LKNVRRRKLLSSRLMETTSAVASDGRNAVKEEIRISKHEIQKFVVIGASGYRVVPACGRQGYQDIRASGLRIPTILTSPDILVL